MLWKFCRPVLDISQNVCFRGSDFPPNHKYHRRKKTHIIAEDDAGVVGAADGRAFVSPPTNVAPTGETIEMVDATLNPSGVAVVEDAAVRRLSLPALLKSIERVARVK